MKARLLPAAGENGFYEQARVNQEWVNQSDVVLYPGIAQEGSHWTNSLNLPGVRQVRS